MPDVVIRRCTVRVVRRGGWSWGPDPRRLLRNVVDAVPALVAAKLGDLCTDLPDGSDIAEPVVIRVPVSIDEIRAQMRAAGGGESLRAAPWARRIDEALDAAMPRVLEDIGSTKPTHETPVVSEPDRALPLVLLAALREWRSSGTLRAVLASIDEEGAAALLQALAEHACDLPEAIVDVLREALTASPGDATHGPAASQRSAMTAHLLRIADIAAEAHATPLKARGRTANAALDVVSSGGRPQDSGVADVEPGADTPPQTPGPATEGWRPSHAETTPPSRQAAPLIDADVHVPSALPWLLLGPLHRMGYLQMLAAVLEMAGLQASAPMFGAAFAYKLAPPAGREWQKSADADRLAAAAAGVRGPVDKPDLHRFASRLSSYCALLDGQIAHAVVQGRRSGDPWFVHRLPGDADASSNPMSRFAVVDPQGWFAAWWGVDPEGVAACLSAAPPSDAIVPASSADPRLLERLASAQTRFLTTARPGRGERWSRVAGGWWSNLAGEVSETTRGWLSRVDELTQLGDALGEELGRRRVAFPLDRQCALEHSLALAISVALATLAWELWHQRERTDPLLALRRLEDLDARVRFAGHTVRVVVPLGRRHRDLYDAGLLADIPGVPWLAGRTVEFSGG